MMESYGNVATKTAFSRQWINITKQLIERNTLICWIMYADIVMENLNTSNSANVMRRWNMENRF